ncbi:MAG: peptidyl-prolyl cis-trans isomerase [Planctomycetes bacterium]|nr:peptidyl-prolyl cis-trans isomerase [Planctomycetota bacterium]
MAATKAGPAPATAGVRESDLIARLKLQGLWQSTGRAVQAEALVAQAAAAEGLAVSDQELQEAFDEFRVDLGLRKAADTHEWLHATGLTVEEVERHLEAGLLRAKLADAFVTPRQIEEFYAQNPRRFEFARASHIVVKDAGAAQELALTLREEGEDFARLAQQHSLDAATGYAGGFLGVLTRETASGLPPDVADRIFAAQPGEIVGPFPIGDAHAILRVEHAGRQPLDEALRERLRQELFREWLTRKLGA